MIASEAPNLEHARPMMLQSELLGPLSVPEDAVIAFPAGLFGFPDCRGFALLPANREGMFWLQSVEHPALAFVLIDPFPLFPDYAAEVGPSDMAELGAGDGSEVAVLAIVTLPASRSEQPTANLQGPIALSLKSRLGKQLALQDPDWGVRCPFDLVPRAG